MNFILPTYEWRGKTYKSISTFTRVVLKKHPFSAVSFDKDAMHVRSMREDKTLVYPRTIRGSHSIIADQPEE